MKLSYPTIVPNHATLCNSIYVSIIMSFISHLISIYKSFEVLQLDGLCSTKLYGN